MPNKTTVKLFQFTADLQKFAEQAKKDLAVQVADTATDLFVKIVTRTPVLTGLARSNWNISTGAPDLSQNFPGEYPAFQDNPRGEALSKADRALAGIRAGELEPIYLANDTEYIDLLENGSSRRQAPFGMVKISIDEVELQINMNLK